LSLCHNAVPEKNDYTSSSPDELALVNFAKFAGYEFVQKNDYNELEILERVGDHEKIIKYRLLHTL
jgi:phospholipid-transporting ATPase